MFPLCLNLQKRVLICSRSRFTPGMVHCFVAVVGGDKSTLGRRLPATLRRDDTSIDDAHKIWMVGSRSVSDL